MADYYFNLFSRHFFAASQAENSEAVKKISRP